MKNKFLFGVSSAAFQIEGDDGTQGRGRSVWDEFCDREDTIFEGQNARVACNHYNLYKQDVKLIGELGADAYRFSVSWSRLIPEGRGEINPLGASFYDKLIDEMLNCGVEPCMTLYHWDLPEALSKRGGFKNPDFPLWFEEYADKLMRLYGDRVKMFIPFNEPINAIHTSYFAGIFAPGERINKRQTFDAIHNMLLANARAAEVIHSADSDNIVSVSMSTFEEYPAFDTKKCYEAAKKLFFEKPDRTDSVDLYLDPMFLGKYPDWMQKFCPDFVDKTAKDMSFISGKTDYVGYNNYSGHPIGEDGLEITPEGERVLSAMGAPVDHNSIYYNVRFLTERYKKPVIITENGLCADDAVSQDGFVHDKERADYITKSVAMVDKLLSEGIDLRGYFVWSMTDNFEWLHGYSKRFGLIYIDYDTQKRIKKDSYITYKKIIDKRKPKV